MMQHPFSLPGTVMKMRTFHSTAIAALLAAETLSVSPDAIAGGKTAQLAVKLTIEGVCSIDHHTEPYVLDQAKRVAVNCESPTTPHNVALDARTAGGGTVPVETLAGARAGFAPVTGLNRDAASVREASSATAAANYAPVVTVTVNF